MNSLSSTKSKGINFRNILGDIPGLFEDEDFERETPRASAIVQEVITEAYESVSDAVKFSITGSIEFSKKQTPEDKKQQAETEKQKARIAMQKAFYQALKEDQERTRRAKDKLLFEEEINDIAVNLPTDQKNQLLHYQASYRDRSIYQKAELRKKLIELRKKQDNQEKQASIPSPAKQPSALEGAFEGRSGQQGSGTANLSAHATG